MMNKITSYIEMHKKRFIDELIELLKIPSISADSTYTKEVHRCAEKVETSLKEAGVELTQIHLTAGHPIVYGEKIIDPSLPTILIYGHYDVQPADPLELWESDPFIPIIKSTPIHPEGAIFARGACDDKGQFYMHVKAFELMNNTSTLPCNIKFMIEGEEEVGSKNLTSFVQKNKTLLSCDTILISDTGIIANDIPSITIGLKGLTYLEVEVTGPNRDLHSGLYGGAVPNPINILCEMVAKLKDQNNTVTIPGFYEHVLEVSKEEREEIARAPFSLDHYKSELDLSNIHGEDGYTTIERTGIRPTLDLNGIWGGYTGEGAKTVIPSKAYAKISMRLVPNQTQKEITQKFTNYFESIAPDSVKIKITPFHGGEPYLASIENSSYQSASLAMETTYGVKPIPIRTGGSIPIVSLFEKELDVKSTLMGFGLDSDAIHSPNEHYGIFNYLKGIETISHFFINYRSLIRNKH
jgi:acetylornithine deacetylase/succinyl-diaminopimelate desuccinylase-like protein